MPTGPLPRPKPTHSPADAASSTGVRAADAALLWPLPGAGTAGTAALTGRRRGAAVRVRRAWPPGSAPVKRPFQGRFVRAADIEPAPGGGDAAAVPHRTRATRPARHHRQPDTRTLAITRVSSAAETILALPLSNINEIWRLP